MPVISATLRVMPLCPRPPLETCNSVAGFSSPGWSSFLGSLDQPPEPDRIGFALRCGQILTLVVLDDLHDLEQYLGRVPWVHPNGDVLPFQLAGGGRRPAPQIS